MNRTPYKGVLVRFIFGGGMNKLFTAFRTMPTLIKNLHLDTVIKLKDNPLLLVDQIDDPDGLIVQLDMELRFAPPHTTVKKCWYTVDAENMYLVEPNPEPMIYLSTAKFAFTLTWSMLNKNNEKVILDISGATDYEQTVVITPKIWNDLRRLSGRWSDEYYLDSKVEAESENVKTWDQLIIYSEPMSQFELPEDEHWNVFSVGKSAHQLNVMAKEFNYNFLQKIRKIKGIGRATFLDVFSSCVVAQHKEDHYEWILDMRSLHTCCLLKSKWYFTK